MVGSLPYQLVCDESTRFEADATFDPIFFHGPNGLCSAKDATVRGRIKQFLPQSEAACQGKRCM